MADNQYHYDAIVVGSGISGGWAAKELTEKGLKVLMLERGRNIEHITDYINAGKEAWDFPHRNQLPRAIKPMFDSRVSMGESTVSMYANKHDSPYTEIKPFAWVRGYHVGGRSLLWGRQSYRLAPIDFEANAREGIAVDWPIRYDDLAPWYDHVERFAGIAGTVEGLDVLPDGQFLSPIPLNVVEKDVAARLRTAFGGTRRLIHARVAHITENRPEHGRTSCQYRNQCDHGCPYGGYFSTQSATLPAAIKTGNLTLRPFSIVKEIMYDKDKKRARGVEIIDAENGQICQYTASVIFLNASTFNSTWLLMNSATDVWPGGLGSSSGELGHNVMDHHHMCGASGRVEGYEDRYYYGRRPCGFYIPRFRNVGGDRRDYLRGFGYLGAASRLGWQREIAELNIGAELKEALTVPGEWAIGLWGFGEMLPHHDNMIRLDHEHKDPWGLPVLAMDAAMGENEFTMREDIMAAGVETLEAAGVKDVHGYSGNYTVGQGVHEMGTARMGRDPKTSVLNRYNQVWDAPNVYVTDGACMTSGSCVNPSLTYMALTARAADHAIRELKAGNLA